MRVPLSWLREFVDVDLTPEQLAERLTLLGMEVKTIERWGADWEHVVTGELLTVEKHPRADRLSLTTVTLGDGRSRRSRSSAARPTSRPGQRIPVALPGRRAAGQPPDRARREDGRRLERDAVLRRGAAPDRRRRRHPDPAAPTRRSGVPLVDLYGDVVLDVDVKPNRGDALSILGLAREVAAATGQQVRSPEIRVEEGSGPSTARAARDRRPRPATCARASRPAG